MNSEWIQVLIPAACVFCMLMGIYSLFFEKQSKAQENIRDLLGTQQVGQAKTLKTLITGSDDALLKKRKTKRKGFAADLEIKLERANLMIRTEEFMLICIGFGFLGFLLALILLQHHAIVAILEGAVTTVLPYLYLLVRIWLRTKKAEEQFAEVLDALVNSFRTGFGFNRAVHMVTENFDDPWGTEFGKMAVELSLGATQEDVLNNLRRRMPLTDVDLFITAMMIQKETGGNLAELLSNLSKTCRDRFKLYRKISAISAQGKLSATIICIVPFGLTGMMFLFLPEATIEFVTNPIGIVMLVLAGIWMSFGIGVLYKIVSIEV